MQSQTLFVPDRLSVEEPQPEKCAESLNTVIDPDAILGLFEKFPPGEAHIL
jgi:hypothetical protein